MYSVRGSIKKIQECVLSTKESLAGPRCNSLTTLIHFLWVKEFMPLSLGVLSIGSGEQTLKLEAPKIPGAAAIDVHSIQIVRRDS